MRLPTCIPAARGMLTGEVGEGTPITPRHHKRDTQV